MNLIYEKSFFALGAPGISHLERLASGVPTILIAQNKKSQPFSRTVELQKVRS